MVLRTPGDQEISGREVSERVYRFMSAGLDAG